MDGSNLAGLASESTPALAPESAATSASSVVSGNAIEAEQQSLSKAQDEALARLLPTIGKADSKPVSDRDVTGKFTAKDAKDAAISAPGDDEKPVEEEAKPVPAVPAPSHLTPDVKAVWDKLPPEAQQAISARTLEDRQQLSRLGNTVNAYRPLGAVLNEHRDYFEQSKAAPHEVVGNLMQWNRALESDLVGQVPGLIKAYGAKPAEVQAIVQALSRAYGFDTNQINDNTGLPPDPQTVALQAGYAALQRQNAQLMARLSENEGSVRQLSQAQNAQLEARAEQARASEEQQLTNAVTQFEAGVDKAEWDFLRPYVAAELNKLDPSIPEAQALKTAYDAAKQRLNSFVQPKVSAAQKSNANTASLNQARRIDKANVRGVPAISQTITSVIDAQDDVLRKYGIN